MAKKLFKSAIHAHRGVLAAAVVSVFACAAPGASAETYVYKDVARPHGVARSQAEKQAAFKSCLDAGVSSANIPAYEACMRRQGWALDYVRPDASDKPGATYDDMWQKPNGEKRSEETLNADARACDPSGTKSAASAPDQALHVGARLAPRLCRPGTRGRRALRPVKPLRRHQRLDRHVSGRQVGRASKGRRRAPANMKLAATPSDIRLRRR